MYWVGDRYQIEDVEPFARVEKGGEWRDKTEQERVALITNLERKQTREEFIAETDKDAFIARRTQELTDRRPMWSHAQKDFDPQRTAENQYLQAVENIDDRKVMQNNAEIDRRMRQFSRTLRRSKSGAEHAST